jgi:hypothetical protein
MVVVRASVFLQLLQVNVTGALTRRTTYNSALATIACSILDNRPVFRFYLAST